MKFKLLLICFFSLILTGCKTEYRLFQSIVTYNFDRSYTLSVDGRADVPRMTITRGDLLDGLNIPRDAEVIDVTISHVAAKVSENVEQSQAYFINLEGYYIKPDGKKKLFPQIPIPISSVTFTAINNTIAKDITSLAGQLAAILRDESNTQSASVELAAFSSSPVVVDVEFQLGISVHYSLCDEVPVYWTGSEEKCEPKSN